MHECVLVTGGTGNIGTAFVAALAADAGRTVVRVATRKVDSPAARLLRAMSPFDTVRPVRVDDADPESLRAAMDGVTRLFVIAPFVGDLAGWHEPIAAAAREAGTVGHIVKASVTGARAATTDPPPGHIPGGHFQGEEILRSTGIPTTAIRPTMYMQHFLTVPQLYTPGDERFYLPIGDARVAFVDCRDIATFAAAILLSTPDERARHAGASYELTGPESIGAAEIGAILGWTSGRSMKHIDGEAAFVARCAALGVPDTVKSIYREAAGGWFAKVETEAFERATARRPTSFAKFATDHASHFKAR